MAEYIERAEIMRRFTYEQGDKIREMDEKGFPTTITFRDAKRLIHEIPSVDAAPVVHGRWENNKNEYPECTNCGYMPAYDPAIDDINYSPYCPNCGAKMDGGEKANE